MENTETHKWFSDHNAIKFQLDLGFKKLINFSERRKVWNFDNPQDWNKFKTLTSNDSTLKKIWQCRKMLKYWRINSNLHKCFPKKAYP